VADILLLTAQNVTMVDERGDRDKYRKLRIRFTVTTAMAVVAVVAASTFVVYSFPLSILQSNILSNKYAYLYSKS